METILVKEKPDLPAWVKNCNNSLSPNSIFALSKTTNSLVKCLKNQSVKEINFYLEQVDINNMNSYHIVNVLRHLYSIRKSLSHWHNIEKNVRQELKSRGLEVNILLYGLDED